METSNDPEVNRDPDFSGLFEVVRRERSPDNVRVAVERLIVDFFSCNPVASFL